MLARAHAANISKMFTVDLGVLKEPRGFIRVLQLFFAILAFSITCGYKGSASLDVKCREEQSRVWTVDFQYPFSPKLSDFDPPSSCVNPRGIRLSPIPCGIQQKVEFFVTVGVLSLFVCMISLPVYLCKTELYSTDYWLPIVDLGVTMTLALFWFISSCTFSAAVSEIKSFTEVDYMSSLIPTCAEDKCVALGSPRFSGLNIAITLGFLNIILWTGSSWFVYKDTPLHSKPLETSISPPPPDLTRGTVTSTVIVP